MGKPNDMALCTRHEFLFRKIYNHGYKIQNENLVDSGGRRTLLEK